MAPPATEAMPVLEAIKIPLVAMSAILPIVAHPRHIVRGAFFEHIFRYKHSAFLQSEIMHAQERIKETRVDIHAGS